MCQHEFSDKSRYDRTFQQVTHKEGESAMKYTKRFQNAQALSVSVENTYSEDQLMHTFLNDFHQYRKYSAQKASHQAELRREEKFIDQKYLFISSLQTDYIILDISSGCGRNSERAKTVHTKCTFREGANHSSEKCFKRIRKEKEKARAAGDLDNRRTERTPQKCFRCGSEDHLIEKCPKPTKEN